MMGGAPVRGGVPMVAGAVAPWGSWVAAVPGDMPEVE